MTDCVIVQPIAEAGIALLREAGLTVHVAKRPELACMREHLVDARAVITRNAGFSAEAIVAAPNLVVIGSHGTGIDSIDLPAAKARGIAVINTPGVNARAVAEHALAMMLACAKALPLADAATRTGDWGFRERTKIIELNGRCLGLVGYGRVARQFGRLAIALGMEVCAVSRHAKPDVLREDGIRPMADLDALCRAADVVSLHGLPDGGIRIGVAELAAMRPGSILINTARGALVDEGALLVALDRGHLSMAALDVFEREPLSPDSPLIDNSRVILTPHMGGLADTAMRRTAEEVASKVLAVLAKKGKSEP